MSVTGALCCPLYCDGGVVLPDGPRPVFGTCELCGAEASVTAAQVMTNRNYRSRMTVDFAAQKARLSAVPRYPHCDCGGPLVLPEQAKVPPKKGWLLCAKEGAYVQVPEDQLAIARAAATAEGFELPIPRLTLVKP